jgi:hypothetical protein
MSFIARGGKPFLLPAGRIASQSQRATLLSGYASFGSAANRFDKAFEVLLDGKS